jgi:hypothetical protein
MKYVNARFEGSPGLSMEWLLVSYLVGFFVRFVWGGEGEVRAVSVCVEEERGRGFNIPESKRGTLLWLSLLC